MTKAKHKEIKKFFSQFPTQKFSKNQTILKPGDKFEYVYFIKNGYVRSYTITQKGENTINYFKPLLVISSIHLTSPLLNNFYFQAITPVEVHLVPYSEFKRYLESDRKFTLTFLEFLSESLLKYFVNQGNIVNGNAQNKIASVLLQLSHDYGNIKKSKLVVNFPATHRILANLIGLTRETTSVQMSILQKTGVISTKRTQFIVNDLDKLKLLAQSSS